MGMVHNYGSIYRDDATSCYLSSTYIYIYILELL